MARHQSLERFSPWKPHYHTLKSGHRMHYVDEGSGPVIVLLHGNPTWSFFYRHLIEDLRRDFRCIAPDYVGCGLSDHPTDVYFRATERIEQVGELLDALGIDRFSLVMHDWGGSIGTGLAVRRPEKIVKMVYFNTTLTETESLPFIIKRAAHPLIGRFLTKTTKHFLRLTTNLGVVKRLSREAQRGYLAPYLTSARRLAIWGFVKDIPFDASHPSYNEMLNLGNQLPLLKDVPVHIVWGLRDPCFHRTMLNKVAHHFPQASIVEIPQAAHLLIEDAPDIVIPSVRAFLMGDRQASKADAARSDVPRSHALVGALETYAQKHPQQNAVLAPSFFGDNLSYSQLRYQDLLGLIYQYERGLQELGLRPGDRALMLVPPGIDFVALAYAVMGRGAIPVLVDPGMGRENLVSVISSLRPNVFIGSPKAQLLRWIAPKAFDGLRFSVTATDWPLPGGPTLSFLRKFATTRPTPVSYGELALVAFTSGATGVPKGVEFTHTMLAETLRIFAGQFDLKPGSHDLPLLPIFSLFTVALGVIPVFPPLDPAAPLNVDPSRIVRLVRELGIRSSFGSPTLWRKIAEYCIRVGVTLPSLERVFIAGAPVPQGTLGLLNKIMPNGMSFTPYGATEALPVSLISGAELAALQPETAQGGELGTCVGKPVNGLEIRVIETRDGIVRDISDATRCGPGEIGEIIVRGLNVSPRYLGNTAATERGKISDGETLWHRMGDVGYLDRAGNLYYCGRCAHTVRVGARVYYSEPVELIFNQCDRVRRSALVALNGGADVGVAIEPFPEFFPNTDVDRNVFEARLREHALKDPLTAQITKFFFHPSFPVDPRHNAKIFRDRLGSWATKELGLQKAA